MRRPIRSIPPRMVDKVHAIYLGGGSAFGLAGADGVMRWLEEQGHGFDVMVAKVPIVPGAILFDSVAGDAKAAPMPAVMQRLRRRVMHRCVKVTWGQQPGRRSARCLGFPMP
ncbi:MAG: hypothetical protein R2932_46055 [Caldilineaceae bacterium]